MTHLSIAKTVYDGNKKSLEGGRNNKLMGIQGNGDLFSAHHPQGSLRLGTSKTCCVRKVGLLSGAGEGNRENSLWMDKELSLSQQSVLGNERPMGSWHALGKKFFFWTHCPFSCCILQAENKFEAKIFSNPLVNEFLCAANPALLPCTHIPLPTEIPTVFPEFQYLERVEQHFIVHLNLPKNP